MDGRIGERVRTEQPAMAGLIPPVPQPDRDWSVESRPLTACQEIAADWSALGRRALAANPCFEPGFLLPAVQHLVAFREVSALLIWKGEAGRGRRLVGFMPYRRKTRMLRSDTLSGCVDARLLCDWPLLDRDAALPVLSMLLRAFDRIEAAETSLRLHAIAPDNPLMPLLHGLGRTVAVAPGSRPVVRAEEDRPAPVPAAHVTLREAVGLTELRDGVEILMALEASGPLGRAGGAALQDTREAAFLRAMTRNLARAKLCQISLLMDQDRPVAAALTLGKGKRRWLYKAAAEPAASIDNADRTAMLVAAIRRATPGLVLLAEGDRPVGAGMADPARDLLLIGGGPRTPADLARSLRARLDRALFRPRPVAAGE